MLLLGIRIQRPSSLQQLKNASPITSMICELVGQKQRWNRESPVHNLLVPVELECKTTMVTRIQFCANA